VSTEVFVAPAGFAWRRDIIVAVALAALASFSSYSRSSLTQTLLPDGNDVWFESDLGRIVANMSEHRSDHYRTEVHPLFSLMTTPLVYGLRALLGISAVPAIRIVVAATAATWTVALFGLLRLAGLRTFAAAWFTGLGVASAATVCWFAVPETFPLGSVTMMLALMVTAISSTRQVPAPVYTSISALTLSVTVTNWMAGLVMTALGLPARRAIRTTVNALGLVTAAWAVQKVVFRSARFFIRSTHELKYLEPVTLQRLWQVMRSFFVHALVLPAYVVVDAGPYRSIPLKLVTQFSPIASDRWGLVAVSAWLGLLAIGAFAMVTLRDHRRLRLSVALVLGGQLALHLVYGNETFLYSLHWVPLLVLVAAMGVHTRARGITLVLAVVALTAMLVSNVRQFERAAMAAQTIMTGAEARPARP
jgi:hypothetical protein